MGDRGGEMPGHPLRQTQWWGTNAWHSVVAYLPTATLATVEREGSVRGESSLTDSKHSTALHTVRYTLLHAASTITNPNRGNNVK